MGGYFEVQGDKPCWHYYCWLQRSIEDELDRESNSDIVTILISYLVMFAYITLFLGQFHSCDRILVSQDIPFSHHFFSSLFFPTPLLSVHTFSSVCFFLKMLVSVPTFCAVFPHRLCQCPLTLVSHLFYLVSMATLYPAFSTFLHCVAVTWDVGQSLLSPPISSSCSCPAWIG